MRLCVHDIAEAVEGSVAPDESHIADLLGFARSWDRTAPFLVHCWAGISRSTAAAYILLCDLHGAGTRGPNWASLTLARFSRATEPADDPARRRTPQPGWPDDRRGRSHGSRPPRL
jgi:predicted protein tyrosine phosphatase